MVPTPAAVLLLLAALMATAVLQLSAATPSPSPAAPRPVIGLPGCNTTCGNVSVPYPFGFGPSCCYRPGLNLTCDTTHDPPRLLLGDHGTLRVAEISLENATVRVMRAGAIINTTGDDDLTTSPGWNASLDEFGRGLGPGYDLSSQNELVVSGCNVQARLLAGVGEKSQQTLVTGGCATFCTIEDDDGSGYFSSAPGGDAFLNETCSLNMGCCKAPITLSTSRPKGVVEAKWIQSGNHKSEQQVAPVNVFVAEKGWLDHQKNVTLEQLGMLDEVPVVLDWMVTRDLPPNDGATDQCSEEVSGMLCRSEHSRCGWPDDTECYLCLCQDGYQGNPYLAGGCQDIDECKLPSEEGGCFGACINTNGSKDCRCPRGTFGNPGIKDGCVKLSSTTDVLLYTAAQAHTGLPNCDTTCGSMQVPYPFGISPECSWPGFNLTCDTSHDPPRLLLLNGNGSMLVVDTFLPDSSLRVIYTSTSDNAYDIDNGHMMVDFQLPGDIREPYVLSSRNEFILYGCDVNATLLDGEHKSNRSSSTTTNSSTISDCVSTCNSGLVMGDGGGAWPLQFQAQTHGGGRRYCSGRDGCCHAPISVGRTPKKVEFSNKTTSQDNRYSHAFAFISEEGLTDQWYMIFNRTDLRNSINISSPIVLQWEVKQGLPPAPADEKSGKCRGDVANKLCKSEHSECRQENGGYTCQCSNGYIGNPYVAQGCQDECYFREAAAGRPCFGHCKTLPGRRFECRCPPGTHGNASIPDGCIRIPLGVTIGLSVAGGPFLFLLVMTTILVLRKINQRRIKALKQKYFKQNRGQLLQQLVSQKADIAERMIISVDELAKATNNFDKARELGGGGHGTVYKGILSDLHVVAIKKSKITVQKEIDEFINEVAILSQINHKNVVKLLGCCLETEVPLLVYEFISNGTLYDHLHVEGPRSLSWGDRLRIATEIATSLAYLHSSVSVPIIHRDIKSSNILLDDTMTSKISDFGASRYVPIDKTGLTTRVQGTIGYLDPMYFYTGRLTEKSDVYSFGVILVELLTRKKPFSYLSAEGDGLVSHFVNLFSEENLVQIIDPQVIDEGGREVQEVAALAASCINLRGEERPTMRQVEHSLHWLQGSKRYKKDGIVAEELENVSTMKNCALSSEVGKRYEESSRRYSLEQEMMFSARYPR